jgi:hypothetical protein
MIRVRVTDEAAFAARTPAELSTYLRARGWRLSSRTETAAYWTTMIGADELELLQPLDRGLRDYTLRVADAISLLAKVEERSELDILREVSESTWDVHTLRLFPADESAGLIGLEDGVLAYECLRSMVSAAAYPVFSRQPRAVQPARKPQGMTEFLRSVRVGPAVEGSFVMTVHTPVPPRLSDQPVPPAEPVPESDEPIERQVSLAMYRAVQAAHQAADAALLSTDGLELFTAAVNNGVSANLCEALAGFGGHGGGNPFDFALCLAASRPSPSVMPPIRFHRHHLPVLKEAAAELRARTPEDDVAVVGDVVRLHREGSSGGEITLVGKVEDSDVLRRMWMELSTDEYELAMAAHRDAKQVVVKGSLVRRGTRSYLARPTGFRVVAAGD